MDVKTPWEVDSALHMLVCTCWSGWIFTIVEYESAYYRQLRYHGDSMFPSVSVS